MLISELQKNTLTKENIKQIRKYLITKYDAMKVEPMVERILNSDVINAGLTVNDIREILKILKSNLLDNQEAEIQNIEEYNLLTNEDMQRRLLKQEMIIESLQTENQKLKHLLHQIKTVVCNI